GIVVGGAGHQPGTEALDGFLHAPVILEVYSCAELKEESAMKKFAVLPWIAAAALAAGCLTAEAKIVEQTVTYQHGGQTMKGYLAYDDAAGGPRPGVLVVHEWWGLDDYIRQRTRQVAEMGYVAFAPDIY